MRSSKDYIEQVGAFLDNELSGSELEQFNEELARNPELAKEVNFQKEIIEGIKEYRHLQLKARLDSIQVGGGLLSATATKIVTGALIMAGIGFGIYSILTPSEIKEKKNQVIESVETPTETADKNTDQATQTTTEDIQIDQTPETPADEPESKDIDNPVRPVREGSEDNTQVLMDTPEVPQPESFEMENPSEEDLEIPQATLGNDLDVLDSNLEVEIISDKRKYPFHYQVLQGRLLLYGNFDEEPYELLEISMNDERKLYLFFKSKYYEIVENTEDITPLQSISSKSLISELEKLKNKRP